MNKKITFQKINTNLHTNTTFNKIHNINHHKNPSPFHNTNIKLQIISQFPLNYIHLIYLKIYNQTPHIILNKKSLKKSFQ